MTIFQKSKSQYRCSFCGKAQDDVQKLIAGPKVYICDECVGLCEAIIDDTEYIASETGDVWASTLEHITRSDEECRGAAGWQLLGYLAMHDKTLPDEYFEHYLGIIERDIHSRKNRVRYSMNTTLIGIGLRGPNLQEKAIAVARRRVTHVWGCIARLQA